ncbi:hypothetical protein [Dongia sp.]|uniref:hypothetical protein n=1 Tax=Dongia sp. TaxID=1977262 RepID=UPI0035B2F27E
MPAAGLAVLGMGAISVVAALPQENQPVAVYSWQGDALASVIAAGGRLLGPGGLPGSIIAIGDTPDFNHRLYAAGASLVLRADPAMGCTSSEKERSS